MSAHDDFYEKALGAPSTRAENADTAAAIYAVACAICQLSDAVHRLGNADAATPMGAIEGLSKHISEALDRIAESRAD